MANRVLHPEPDWSSDYKHIIDSYLGEYLRPLVTIPPSELTQKGNSEVQNSHYSCDEVYTLNNLFDLHMNAFVSKISGDFLSVQFRNTALSALDASFYNLVVSWLHLSVTYHTAQSRVQTYDMLSSGTYQGGDNLAAL